MADRPTDKDARDVDALFERERKRGEPSEEMKREVRARLDASLSGAQPMAGDLSRLRPASPAGAGRPGFWAGVRPSLVAVGTGFVLAGGLGLLWMASQRPAIEPAPPAVSPPSRIALPPAEPILPAPTSEVPPAPPDSPSRSLRRPIAHQDRRLLAPPAPAPAPSARDADLDLAIERDLLQRARADFRGGRLTEALQPLEEHARRFPRGRLEEERDALRIQTLARLGDVRRASALARAFSAQFPDSPLVGAVRSSVGAAPGAAP